MIEPRLDLDYVRRQFPAFEEPALRDKAFFENAGGSYVCRHVIWRLSRFYREHKVQPNHGFDASRIAGQEMDDAHTRLAQMLGIQTSELSLGPSTTQNTYVLSQAFAEWLPEGAAIIVTDQDHEANSGPWRRLAARGFELREWQMDPETGHLSADGLRALLDDRVALVCFPHCSNILGEINDVAHLTRIAHDAGALVCVDGVSYAPHGFPNVGALDADIYLFSAYKTFGPHQGIMCMRRELALQLPNQGHVFNADRPEKRFTPAGPDHAQVAACAGLSDYYDALYDKHYRAGRDAKGRAAQLHDLFRAHETRLMEPLLEYLRARNDVRLLGPDRAAHRAPTLSLVVQDNPQDLVSRLNTHGIMAGAGHFYASRCLRALGVDASHGVLRLSFVHYTSEAEVDRLLEALDHVL